MNVPASTGRPLRVMFVIGCRYHGGAFEFLADIVPRLRRRGVEALVVCHADFVRTWCARNGIPCRFIRLCRSRRQEWLPYIVSSWRLAWTALVWRADVVYGNHLNAAVGIWLACKLARLRSVVMDQGFHTIEDFYPWERRAIRGATVVVPISEAVRANFIGMFGGRQQDYPLIRHFLKPREIERVRALLEALRTGVARTVDSPVIGMVSRIAPDKRQDLGLRFFKELLVRLPSARLLIAGAPNDSAQSAYLAELHRLVVELGIERRVEFIGFQEDMDAVFSRLDMVISPSPEEAFGRVVIEAYSHGLPVLAFRGGASHEVVRVGDTGWIGEPAAPGAEAAPIAAVLADAAAYRAFRLRCLECAVRDYSGEGEIAALETLLRRCADGEFVHGEAGSCAP